MVRISRQYFTKYSKGKPARSRRVEHAWTMPLHLNEDFVRPKLLGLQYLMHKINFPYSIPVIYACRRSVKNLDTSTLNYLRNLTSYCLGAIYIT